MAKKSSLTKNIGTGLAIGAGYSILAIVAIKIVADKVNKCDLCKGLKDNNVCGNLGINLG